ncbi:MAG: serine hydrolase [Lewinellaceae bacterium]|nr:serine hydrolase [Lewinellaceae bacterium]
MRITLNPCISVLGGIAMMIIPPTRRPGSPELTARIDAYVTLTSDGCLERRHHHYYGKGSQLPKPTADWEWAIPGLMPDFGWRLFPARSLEVMVLQLVEAGLLRLDQPWQILVPDYPRVKFTIRQLLAHRAGIPHLNNFSTTTASASLRTPFPS